MAERRELPAFLAATHARFRTPHLAILLTAALMLALALSGTFIYLLTISTLARLAVYGATCASLPLLRRRLGPAPFRTPAGVALSVAAVALIVWLLGQATRFEARDTAVAALAGLLIHAVYRAARRT
jgi:amino acid transporter